MKLSELKTGEKGIITRVTGHGSFRKRVIELGFVNGKTVRVVRNAPLKDPVEYEVMGSQVALQRAQAAMIEVVGEHENICESKDENAPLDEYRTLTEKEMQEIATRQEKTITVCRKSKLRKNINLQLPVWSKRACWKLFWSYCRCKRNNFCIRRIHIQIC
jgi:ferrous iron transport protein B